MYTTARHFSIMPPTPQATRPVQLRCRRRRKLRLAPFRQDSAWACWTEDSQEQTRKSRNGISFACNAIMHEQYVILYYIVGPTCRGPNGHVRVPLRYKREALAVHDRLLESLPNTQTHAGLSSKLTQTQAIQHTVDVGYYALAARTTQNLLCSSCS